MPRVRNRRRHQDAKDSCCFELFLFCFFFYCMINMWQKECSWYFNQYTFSSYTLMIFIRKFNTATLDHIETNTKIQVILVGIMMPIFMLHTLFGGIEFFSSDIGTCRMKYQGQVFYIIVFMFAISMCFVFILLILCVLVPIWYRKIRRRRQRQDLAGRLQGMEGIVNDNNMNEGFLQGDNANQNDRRSRSSRLAVRRRENNEQRQQLEELLEYLNNQLNLNDEELESILDRRQRERGMTNEQIERLSQITVSDRISKQLKDECCSICLDAFSENMEIRQLAGCGHHFHKNCIDQWLSRKSECPNCKTNQIFAQDDDDLRIRIDENDELISQSEEMSSEEEESSSYSSDVQSSQQEDQSDNEAEEQEQNNNNNSA